MIRGGTGGGNTITGLNFEKETDIRHIFSSMPGYKLKQGTIGWKILYNGKEVAQSYRKNDLYRFFDEKKLNWKSVISKKLLPDDALYIVANNTLFIIEIKCQKVPGSVDEKLQTCDFKKKQYKKLMSLLNIEVEYIYILNDWFKQPGYKDVLHYIISVNCQYYFNYLPLQKLGLPVPTNS